MPDLKIQTKTVHAVDALTAAQAAQDNGGTWGEAREEFMEAYNG